MTHEARPEGYVDHFVIGARGYTPPTRGTATRNRERAERRTVARRLDCLAHFIEGDAVERCPAFLRVGFTRAEWGALTAEARRTYARAILRAELRAEHAC
jgi:hypothetical protein